MSEQDWLLIEEFPPPDYTFVWMCCVREGKDTIEPTLAYYDSDDDFYYAENGLGYARMTHWQKPSPPAMPDIRRNAP